jgi:hypothetical protein
MILYTMYNNDVLGPLREGMTQARESRVFVAPEPRQHDLHGKTQTHGISTGSKRAFNFSIWYAPNPAFSVMAIGKGHLMSHNPFTVKITVKVTDSESSQALGQGSGARHFR